MKNLRELIRPCFAPLLTIFSIVCLCGAAYGQEVIQMKLSDDMVKRFLAAQKDYTAVTQKLVAAGGKAGPGLQKELDQIASKHGFESYAKFEDVGVNVNLVFSGIDPKTGAFVDPVDRLKQEYDDINGDAQIPAEEKKLLLADLNAEMREVGPLKFKGNVEVVKRHLAELEALMPEEEPGQDAPPQNGAPVP